MLAALLLALVPWGRDERWLAVPPLLVVAQGALVALNGRAPLLAWGRRLFWLMAPIFVSLALVQGLFYPGARTVIWQVGPLSFKREGLLFATLVGGRLLLVVGAFMVLLTTTHPADLTAALVQVGLPPEGAYLVLAAIQLLPRMQARAQAIMAAQQARGLALEGAPWQRARALLPLVGPLVLGALHEVDERAMALEARAFRAPRPKTSLRTLHDSPAQRLGRWLLVLASGIVLTATRWPR